MKKTLLMLAFFAKDIYPMMSRGISGGLNRVGPSTINIASSGIPLAPAIGRGANIPYYTTGLTPLKPWQMLGIQQREIHSSPIVRVAKRTSLYSKMKNYYKGRILGHDDRDVYVNIIDNFIQGKKNMASIIFTLENMVNPWGVNVVYKRQTWRVNENDMWQEVTEDQTIMDILLDYACLVNDIAKFVKSGYDKKVLISFMNKDNLTEHFKGLFPLLSCIKDLGGRPAKLNKDRFMSLLNAASIIEILGNHMQFQGVYPQVGALAIKHFLYDIFFTISPQTGKNTNYQTQYIKTQREIEDLANKIYNDSREKIRESDFGKKEWARYKQYHDTRERVNSDGSVLESAFAQLQLSANSTFEEAKKQYYRLVKQYHPDRVRSQGISDRAKIEQADKKMKKINAAFDIISKNKDRLRQPPEL